MKLTRTSPDPDELGHQLIDPAILRAPLDVIAADNLRERQICADLDRVATSDVLEPNLAQLALHFLIEEFGVHIRDETEDLIPLLRRRCPPDENIDRTITRLRSDQESAQALLPQIQSVLADCLDASRVPTRTEAALLLVFTRHTRRHLTAENAILLPLARVRLTDLDLESLCLRMQARRGITQSIERCHA